MISFLGLRAQDVALLDHNAVNESLSSLYQMEGNGFTASAMTFAAPQLYLQTPDRQMITGRNLLIAGGCCLAVGAAIFPLAWLCISDSPGARTLGGICSIGGVTLMGTSVPLFISGSVLYVKGKKHNAQMAFTGNGFMVRF